MCLQKATMGERSLKPKTKKELINTQNKNVNDTPEDIEKKCCTSYFNMLCHSFQSQGLKAMGEGGKTSCPTVLSKQEAAYSSFSELVSYLILRRFNSHG